MSMYLRKVGCMDFSLFYAMGRICAIQTISQAWGFALWMCWCCTVPSFGQKLRTVQETGEYQMRVEKNMSKLEAETVSMQRARLDAIAKAFGTVYSQDNASYIKNGSSGAMVKTESRYSYLSHSFVNGEWLEDVGKPEVRFFQNKDEDWVAVRIKGKIREIMSSPVSFHASPLSCPQVSCATTEFNHRQDLYLSFKAPMDGYLAVYLEVPEENVTYRLLPYRMAGSQSCLPVKGDQEYVFFSPENDRVCQYPKTEVDQIFIVLGNKEIPESRNLIVLFSPRGPLEKPLLNQAATTHTQQKLVADNFEIPFHLDRTDFQTWLQGYRIRNNDLQFSQTYIDIH